MGKGESIREKKAMFTKEGQKKKKHCLHSSQRGKEKRTDGKKGTLSQDLKSIEKRSKKRFL